MRELTILFIMLILAISAADATVITIDPVDVQSFRFTEEQLWELNGLSVMYSQFDDDRVAVEYDISGLDGSEILLVELYTWVDNFDEAPPDGIIDIFGYSGDGVVTTDDFYAGGALPDVSEVVGDVADFISIDITDTVVSAITAGWDYLGIRLSTETDDRYVLDNNFPELDAVPVLHVTVPEPATVILLGLGGLLLCKKRKTDDR